VDATKATRRHHGDTGDVRERDGYGDRRCSVTTLGDGEPHVSCRKLDGWTLRIGEPFDFGDTESNNGLSVQNANGCGDRTLAPDGLFARRRHLKVHRAR
jgi:hypothetical protein